jgi:branched-chain amino acid transport system ATP-binding protein
MTLLEVSDLRIAYGDFLAVHGVSLSVQQGEVFVLLGANGAGKTSILRCISGLVAPRAGEVSSEGRSLLGLRPHEIAAHGIAHVPEGRRVFPNLTVQENLTVSYLRHRNRASLPQTIDAVYEVFPRLAERRTQHAATMSGGEQQMLAIGRALMNAPKLLMLDEPSLGLSPVMTELVFDRLAQISRSGMAILLVEQNAICLDLATRGLVLTTGEVVLSGDRAALADSGFVRRAYLGL